MGNEVFTGKPISGSTTINHAVRIKLQLTNNEYVLLQFLEISFQEKRVITYELIYRKIGMDVELFNTLREKLKQGLWIKDEKVGDKVLIRVTKRFREAFYVNEQDFNDFWLNPKTKTADWPGSRTDALAKYVIARKEYPADYLLKQKHWYFRMLALPEYAYRQKMGAPVFLNMRTKRFEEDFESQWREVTGKTRIEEPVQSLDMAKKEELFK